eukprot:TRINITY_DN25810_c2_g1_i1.p1 TRINITY_DN25810_c2_g1~~TRINITY_DN25810_c2_g1_i1.p1  ORF type:complete len:437 (-),score=25.72 TRINITY_DN25810_c2_g1_i1:134-1444(-)
MHPTVNSCVDYDSACKSNFSRQDKAPYCNESTLDYKSKKLPCEFWTRHEAEILDGEGVALTTRARKLNATKLCDDAALLCADGQVWNYTLEEDVYIMDIKKFWLWIEHSMTSAHSGLNSTSTDLRGRWMCCDTKPCAYKDLLPVPNDWGLVVKEPVQSAASSALANTSDSKGAASLLETNAWAKSAKASIVRSEISARGSQASAAKSRVRSRRAAKRHAASSAKNANALKTSARETHGELFDFRQPGIDAKREVDLFPIGYLLDVSRVDMDAPYKNATHRQFGVVITLVINYRNTQVDILDFVGLRFFPWTKPLHTRLPWDRLESTRARYDVYAYANNQGYMTMEKELYTHSSTTYNMWKFNGIYVDVEQSGEMLVWNWSKAAIFLTTTVGLLNVAFILTNFWATRQRALKNLIVDRYVLRDGSDDYDKVDSYDDV